MKSFRFLLIGLALTVVVLGAWGLDLFTGLELSSLNLRFENRGPRAVQAPVVLVAIDDESLNGWIDSKGHELFMPERWTWPRTVYARLVDNLKAAGAKVIGFDLEFSESSQREPSQDLAFAAACKRAGNVVLGVRFTQIEGAYAQGRHLETLIPPLATAAVDTGLVNLDADPDNFRRRVALVDPESQIPNLDLAILRQYLWGKPEKLVLDETAGTLTFGSRVAHAFRGVLLPANYVGGPGTFPTYSFHQVFDKSMDMSVFKDKMVLVGSTSPILHDNFFTPFSGHRESMPGVEIHANVIDTLYSGQYLSQLSNRWEALLILGLGLLTCLATFKIGSWQGTVVVAAELGLYVWLCFAAFSHARIILPVAAPVASIFVSFAGLAAYRGIVEERRARDVRNQFSRYVSKSIVDEIMKDPTKISLGGQTKEVTILFSDVRDFTPLSEKLQPDELVAMLNEYLTAMVDVVMENGGTLDKYVGDAIMAVWGSPLPDPQHRQKAVTTAVKMLERLQVLRQKLAAEGKPLIDIGIGLNSGKVVAGNMGHLH